MSTGMANISATLAELLTLLEHQNSPPFLIGVRIARYLVFHVMICRSLSVLLRFTASDYPFGAIPVDIVSLLFST
jgi:hypothetical protein